MKCPKCGAEATYLQSHGNSSSDNQHHYYTNTDEYACNKCGHFFSKTINSEEELPKLRWG